VGERGTSVVVSTSEIKWTMITFWIQLLCGVFLSDRCDGGCKYLYDDRRDVTMIAMVTSRRSGLHACTGR
jgi:hypothetical protein